MANSNEDVKSYYDFILPLVLKAGKELLEVKEVDIEYKKDQLWDLVTIYDRKIEEILIQQIKKRYPNHKHIGEEESESSGTTQKLTDDPTWIIDPIDGTANFVRNMPLTCISIGIRSLGTGVIGLCYVACGRTDAYQCDGLYPWDAAAGTLIVTEAGGHVTDSSGKEFDLMDPNFLATATKELADQYLEIERKADDEQLNSTRQNKPFVP